jgi:hypothetical protein
MARALGSGRIAFYGISALGIVGALMYAGKVKTERAESIYNYKIGYTSPEGYKAITHGPQALFLYRNLDNRLLLRGSVNQVYSDVNPTPELQTEGIAQYYLDRTAENQPGWTGTKMDLVEGQDANFRLIRRENKSKCVITAFAVKGNTTVLVSLSGNDKEVKSIDTELPHFRDYLKSIRLNERKFDN